MKVEEARQMEMRLKRCLALHHLINKYPERVLLMCDQCGKAYPVRDMQVRKAPGKSRFYFGKRCNDCAAGKTEKENN